MVDMDPRRDQRKGEWDAIAAETVEQYRARKLEFIQTTGLGLEDGAWDYVNGLFTIDQIRFTPELVVAIAKAFDAGYNTGYIDGETDSGWR